MFFFFLLACAARLEPHGGMDRRRVPSVAQFQPDLTAAAQHLEQEAQSENFFRVAAQQALLNGGHSPGVSARIPRASKTNSCAKDGGRGDPR